MSATSSRPVLAYRGEPMNREPSNMLFETLADRLMAGRTVIVVLEPGDATRYDFIIARAENENINGARLLVARTHGSGGDLRCAAFVYDDVSSYESRQGIAALADGHEWSEALFAWWFRELWAAIDGES